MCRLFTYNKKKLKRDTKNKLRTVTIVNIQIFNEN